MEVRKNPNYKLGWQVQQRFQISIHVKDKALLQEIQSYYGVGSINWTHGPNTIQLRVQSFQDLETIINHFQKFPLITQKLADYKLFQRVFILIKNREHLTKDGLRKIVAIRAAMNLGLPYKLKLAFPDVVPVERPLVELPKTIDPEWLAGFTSAEGCFLIEIKKSKNSKFGETVQLKFILVQHQRDEELMISIIKYLDCGTIYKREKAIYIRVTNFYDIANKIIPFFRKNSILGVKAQDFNDFCLVTEMIKNKKHLLKEGLEQIKTLKAEINKGRKEY